jgi:hypothetical protein
VSSTCQYNGYTACTNGYSGSTNRSCTDRLADRSNCGGCGTACAATQGCLGGACTTQVTGQAYTPTPGGPSGICGADGLGPLITLSSTALPRTTIGTTCSGDTAATTFTFGICACETYSGGGAQSIDAFDSTVAPYGTAGFSLLGGSIGVNSAYTNSSSLNVSGDLFAWSALSLGNTTVSQRLHGNSTVNGNYTVGGSAEAKTLVAGSAGSVGVTASFPDRNLYTSNSCPVSGWSVQNGGVCSRINPWTELQLPCKRCAGVDQVPIVAYIDNYKQAGRNDNALIGLSPTALANQTANQVLELPCGYYALSAITSTKNVQLNVHGNAALFVDGEVDVGATFSIYVDPRAHFDLFVRGKVSMGNNSRIGNMNVPANMRLYIAGVCTSNCGGTAWALQPGNPQIFGVGTYTPNGAFNPAGSMDMFGALFAKDYIQGSGSLNMHYDKAFARQNATCPPPSGQGCTTCLQCSNQACVIPSGQTSGQCGACTSDSQCCAPLRCVAGSCQFTGF